MLTQQPRLSSWTCPWCKNFVPATYSHKCLEYDEAMTDEAPQPNIAAPATSEIRETLNARGANYGTFMENARISQDLMAVIEAAPGYIDFEPDQKVATWIIMQKLSRALSGNAQYDDNWRDIAGYAQLIVDRINGTGVYYVEPELVTTEQLAASTNHCWSCQANLGDAHLPDCAEGGRQNTRRLRRSPRS